MARYNVRDLLGHWVAPRSGQGKMCPHACCRNKRVHPANMPVILPNRLLRRASDDDLAEHYQRVSPSSPTPQQEAAQAQVLYEMERRDRTERQRESHREAVASTRAARSMERESEFERISAQAEAYTRGYLVSPAGRAAGIGDREILAGREATFRRYASDEAREFFSSTPRPTAAYLRSGKDTRYSPGYSSRRRRRSAGLPGRPARRRIASGR